MRLIDVDKLKEELKVNDLGYQYYMLDNAPTVDAIPIEWIKKYIEYNTKIIVDPKYEVTAHTVNYYIYPHQINTMLEAWEKENGRNE